ncbi:AVAST type 2 anti-phage system protein Avs2 [Myroides odoratus]
MIEKLDKVISKLSVRLKDVNNGACIGTGVIYYSDELKEKLYVLTASHCLFEDGDKFQNQRVEVEIDFLYKYLTSYKSLKVTINSNLLFKEENKDVAVLVLDKKDVEGILGEIPKVKVVKEKSTYNDFIIKGFSKATQGKELAVLYPKWIQLLDDRFQLELLENYTSYNTMGFSGSGVFIQTGADVFLYGIFTRFRAEEKGKVIYAQFIDIANEFLAKSYLPLIQFNYFGSYDLTDDFFKKHIKQSITGLGPRFSEVLNFQLPIAKVFNDIAKDTVFKRQFTAIFDEWITGYGYRKIVNNTHLEQIEVEFEEVKSIVLEWIRALNFSVENKIDIQWLLDRIESINSKVNEKSTELYKLRSEKDSFKSNRSHNYEFPYEAELSRLREIRRYNEDFIFSITKKINIKLSNNPYLIVKGDAGNGKSHLLGDIAQKRVNSNLPTLLLLGQNFHSNKTVWENIRSELGLSCSEKELLIELNNIGKQIGSRVLILIDAINEGGGADLWYDRIASFINDFLDYPFLGLVLSIRTTYIDYVIPDELLKNSNVSVLNHEGFKGNEYMALKLFCDFHELKQPYFPILAPEFSKPLFLKIICEAVKETEEKTFPQGFQGISSVFRMYIHTLNLKFERKRHEYKNRKIVEKAIHYLAYQCFQKEERFLRLEEAFELFEDKFSQFPHLINDLIEENVFIRRIDYDYENKQNEEVIYFSYERLGDFFIAEDLLNKFETKEDLIVSFQKGGEFGRLIEYTFWHFDGLLEAFSVLLPEKFGLEIYEVFSWVFTDKVSDQFLRKQDEDSVNKFFLDSLNWRAVNSIDNDKITKWFKSGSFNIDYDQYLFKLYELAPVQNHPFNSDRINKIFKGVKMSKRDGFWQRHMLWFCDYNDENVAYPIRRLIDWAWTPNVSKNVDFETARLTAQALVWLLASTHRKLRDQTTKALVNLLEQQPEALISILKTFKNIDDLYILERIYAVAYGCVLRTEKIESVNKIANTVYSYVFKNGTPPNHILLRDYARNIVEYAIYLNPNLKIDLSLVRPPYKSKMPESFPTVKKIKEYELDQESLSFKQNNSRMHNLISFSVLEWDFGRKIIKPALEKFKSESFTFKEEYKLFYRSLNKSQREIVTSFKKYEEMDVRYTKNVPRAKEILGEEKYAFHMSVREDFYQRLLLMSEKYFDTEQMAYLKYKILPYLKSINRKDNRYDNAFDTEPIKRWIVKRVFDLGYDCKLHGEYDDSSERNSNRIENKVERIGKKYQWIAFFEILAMVSDNHEVFEDWTGKSSYYKGPWQMYLRDIDPAFICKDVEEDNKELDYPSEDKKWYDEPVYNNWQENDAQWVDNLLDLPTVKNILEKEDIDGSKWLSLKKMVKWIEPKSIGQDEYDRRRKEVFYMLQGYLVHKRDKSKITKWLSKQNFWGRWMPESSVPLSLINRENFWSPIYKNSEKVRKWETISNTNYKVIIASTDAVGEMSDDKSGAHFYYDMPCKTLFEGLGLKYAPIDGDFINLEGNFVAQNINHRDLLFKKEELLNYLKENNLEIIWTLLGEKMSYNSRDLNNNHFKELSGVFYIENDIVKGDIISFDRE